MSAAATSVIVTSSASVTDVTVTSVLTSSVSTAVVTETSTITSDSSTITQTSESTSLSTDAISTVIVSPSTTYVVDTTSITYVGVTTYITLTPTGDGTTQTPTVITVTSTAPAPPPSSATESSSTSQTSTTASSSRASALSPSGSSAAQTSSGGLTSGGKIAIAVVIPIVAIALAVILGLFLFRKRQTNRRQQEAIKNEMADYSYNPNNDGVVAGAAYLDNNSEMTEENSGYRGWGNTSTQRHPSTTMGSGSRGPVGGAISENGSNPSGYHPNGAPMGSENYSGEGLLNNHVAEAGAGAIAGGAVAGMAAARPHQDPSDINRGPSNASSAYSRGPPQSEFSEDMPELPGAPGPYYHEEVPYNIYNDAPPNSGPYGGPGGYAGGAQPPVIQNVGARGVPQIQRAPNVPQPGNPGIAQNF